jgi:general secretion pathway protein A
VSRGIPRLINVICDRALLGAYSENAVRVGVRTVARAAREVRGRTAPRRSRPRWRWASIAAALGLVTIGAALGLSAAPLALRLKPSGLATSGVGLVAEHAPALSARGSAIESSASQPAAAIPAPASRLAPLLAEGRLRTDQASAVATLYSRWGLEQPIVRGQWDCETARADGLRCLFKTGTWATLRRYNLPAVLELIAPGRPKHYAAVTALDNQTVTLTVGGRQLTLPIGEVDPLWAGDFILVWKPPVAIRVPLAPGMYGADVEWLRQRLAAVDGQPSPANKGKLYDAELKDRVVSFQRARSLDPDGLVGDETLAHLASAVPAANVPLLSSTRRVSMATARP